MTGVRIEKTIAGAHVARDKNTTKHKDGTAYGGAGKVRPPRRLCRFAAAVAFSIKKLYNTPIVGAC